MITRSLAVWIVAFSIKFVFNASILPFSVDASSFDVQDQEYISHAHSEHQCFSFCGTIDPAVVSEILGKQDTCTRVFFLNIGHRLSDQNNVRNDCKAKRCISHIRITQRIVLWAIPRVAHLHNPHIIPFCCKSSSGTQLRIFQALETNFQVCYWLNTKLRVSTDFTIPCTNLQENT